MASTSRCWSSHRRRSQRHPLGCQRPRLWQRDVPGPAEFWGPWATVTYYVCRYSPWFPMSNGSTKDYQPNVLGPVRRQLASALRGPHDSGQHAGLLPNM